MYARIEDVKTINEEVNPDSIAVAVGTSHGVYKGLININYELIEEAKVETCKPISTTWYKWRS